MKLNRSGFMMAEVVVVSAIVLLFLATIYASYSKLYSRYRTRLTYFDAVALYQLEYYRDILIENDKLNDVLDDANRGQVVTIYTTDGAGSIFQLPASENPNDASINVFLIRTIPSSSPITSTISADALNDVNINLTFNDYVKYLSTSTEFNSHYVMLLEQCNVGNGDDCKYAYLEIYDGSETPAPVTSSSNSSAPEPSSSESEVYTVTYKANPPTGHTATGSMANSTATFGSPFRTRKNAFKVQGYDFNGWTDNIGVTWKLTSDGMYESGKDWVWDDERYHQNITLSARWVAVGYCCKTIDNQYYYSAYGCDSNNNGATFWCNGKNGACPDTCS